MKGLGKILIHMGNNTLVVPSISKAIRLRSNLVSYQTEYHGSHIQ